MTENSLSKPCYTCNKEKPLSDFYPNKGMNDGHVNQCKLCEKEYKKRYTRENTEKVRKLQKENRKKHHSAIMEGKRIWRKNNPTKHTAHMVVSNAVLRGVLIKQPCEVCRSTEKIHAHHDDYLKPLDVRWLCTIHHGEWHDKNTIQINNLS